MYKKITAKHGEALCRKFGLDCGMDGRTFYATDADETRVYEFDSKRERDAFLNRHNKYSSLLEQ
jgi:hypothetical protein